MLDTGHKHRALPALPQGGTQWDRDRAPAAASGEGQLHARLAAQGSAMEQAVRAVDHGHAGQM